MRYYLSSGQNPSEILILGEAPTPEDFTRNSPFSHFTASQTLLQGIRAMGIISSSAYQTYVLHRPIAEDEKLLSDRKTCPGPGWEYDSGFWVNPELLEGKRRILQLIQEMQPRIVIACGSFAAWATAGIIEVAKWRGSRLQPPHLPCTVVPTLSLLAPITQPAMAPIIAMDFKRAGKIYMGTQLPRTYAFELKPTFAQVDFRLRWLADMADHSKEKVKLGGDLETRLGHIACFGISWNAENAICIPFTQISAEQPFYWTEEQEVEILALLQYLFDHDNILWLGQNYLYDCQYFHRHWGILPRHVFDTMIGHHSIYSNMRKGLDFLSAMYAQDHVYWKEESKDWDPAIGESQYWSYNCKDACITGEITPPILAEQKEAANSSHCEFQQKLFFPVLRMMNRGIRYNANLRGTWDPIMETGTGLKGELTKLQISRQADLDYVAGHPLNPKSPKQLSAFLYTDLGIPGVKNLTGDSLTTNSPALAIIAERTPALKKLCQIIAELRSIGVFISTFIDAKLDTDQRMRCSFGVAGPETFRFNSRENAFGSGMNLQNIPVSEKQKIKAEDYIKLPNIRKLFLPDPGFTFFDIDLDRADLQVVVWEADDKDMKKALRLGLDMHCVNACDIFGIKSIPYEELQENHPNYKEHRGKIGEAKRGKAKAGVHATNYGVGDNKLAMALGITRMEAAQFRAKWFGAHPGVLKWHKRTEREGTGRGYIENKFGARLNTIGRFDLPVALGWGPQSTVAGVINRALVAIDEAEQRGEIQTQLLLQVHDSLGGQFPTHLAETEIAAIQRLATIPIPYDDPLIIPTSINTSQLSWGDAK